MSGIMLAALRGGYAPIVVTCSDLWGTADFSTIIYSASADAAATGGSGSFTWAWAYSSGDANITPVSATSPFTQMKATAMGPGATREAYYSLTATDTVTGQTGSTLVYVNISRGS